MPFTELHQMKKLVVCLSDSATHRFSHNWDRFKSCAMLFGLLMLPAKFRSLMLKGFFFFWSSKQKVYVIKHNITCSIYIYMYIMYYNIISIGSFAGGSMAYYLASAFHKICVSPCGDVTATGLAGIRK